MRRGRPPHPELLTPREQQVLELLREGLTNQEIADRLGISKAGAAYHVSEILSKLDVGSRYEAAELNPEVGRRRLWSLAGIVGLVGELRLERIVKATSVLAIVAGVTLLGFLAVGAGIVLLRDSTDSALACVTGEAAMNPTQTAPDGRVITMPTMRTFETIEEAERWICLDVPQAELLPGWEVAQVTGQRAVSLDMYENGLGSRALAILYRNPELGMQLILDTPSQPHVLEGAGQPQSIEIGDKSGTLWLRDDLPAFVMQWGEGNAAVTAQGSLIGLRSDVSLERDVLPLLETVR